MKALTLWVVVCCLQAQAAADDSLKKAEQLISQMNYDAALTMVQNVLTSKNSEPDALVTAYYLEGVCHASMGRNEKAVEAFRRLLAIQPHYEISENASPREKAPFFEAVSMEGMSPIALRHSVPITPSHLKNYPLAVVVESNPFELIQAIRLRFKADQDSLWSAVTVKTKKTGKVICELPKTVTASSIEYFFEALNAHGGVLVRNGDTITPYNLSTTAKAMLAKTGKKSSSAAAGAIDPNVSRRENVAAASQSETAQESRPWYRTWWFWTAVGVVTAGVVVGVAVAAAKSDSGTASGYSVNVPW